ncbi:glutamate receptor ionotropic, delta-1-like [Palaemon carinicauda]|uniref:glutamate receptor ionotropic, delta-1-like n=1 Tax=Palaemon carinicauda TaxID=392227 RepID=UPI0035B66110
MNQLAAHRLEKWRERDLQPFNEALPSPNKGLPIGTSLIMKGLSNLNQRLGLDIVLQINAELNVPSSVVRIKQNMSPLISILSSSLSTRTFVRRHILVACSVQNIEAIFRMVIVIQLHSHGNVEVLSSTIDNTGLTRFHHSNTWVKTTKGYKKKGNQPLFTDLDQEYSNFHGRTIRVSANNNPPFLFMEETNEGTLTLSSGFEGSIVRALSYALNFTYQMVSPADGKWGGPLEDGSVVGMIGDVFNRKAHFALCEITITRSREGVIDFSYPYYLESLTLVSRVPREKSKALAVFAPFTSEVWISLVFAILAAGIILTLQIAATNRYEERSSQSQPVDEVILNMYRSLLKQDNLLHSNNSFIRLSLTFWGLFCIIVPALYSGMFIATLVKPSFEPPINGLTDLPNAIANKFTLVVTADTSTHYLFKILNEKFVFIAGETGAMYRAMTRGIRRYYFARNTFSPQFYGMACFTGAPFLSIFNKM